MLHVGVAAPLLEPRVVLLGAVAGVGDDLGVHLGRLLRRERLLLVAQLVDGRQVRVDLSIDPTIMSTTRAIDPSGTRSPMSGGSSIGWPCMHVLNLGPDGLRRATAAPSASPTSKSLPWTSPTDTTSYLQLYHTVS